MLELFQDQSVVVIQLGPSYQATDAEALDELGATLLLEANRVDPPHLVLDLSHTRAFGSSFLDLLVRAWKRLRERGGSLVLCGLQPASTEVLQVTRLDTLWDCYTRRADAVAAVRKAAG